MAKEINNETNVPTGGVVFISEWKFYQVLYHQNERELIR